MVAINREMPKGCQHCKFFRKDLFGNGLDYSYSCMLGATEFPYPWIRQMEERASDCPLVEIEERKVGKWILIDEGKNIWKCTKCIELGKEDWWQLNSGTPQDNKMDYCPHCGAEMRGAENG